MGIIDFLIQREERRSRADAASNLARSIAPELVDLASNATDDFYRLLPTYMENTGRSQRQGEISSALGNLRSVDPLELALSGQFLNQQPQENNSFEMPAPPQQALGQVQGGGIDLFDTFRNLASIDPSLAKDAAKIRADEEDLKLKQSAEGRQLRAEEAGVKKRKDALDNVGRLIRLMNEENTNLYKNRGIVTKDQGALANFIADFGSEDPSLVAEGGTDGQNVVETLFSIIPPAGKVARRVNPTVGAARDNFRAFRNELATEIKNLKDIGARMMDSNVELKLTLAAKGDPTFTAESNYKVLNEAYKSIYGEELPHFKEKTKEAGGIRKDVVEKLKKQVPLEQRLELARQRGLIE